MRNATGEHQNVVVFGGTSEIGLAIVTELVTAATRHVVLACRDTPAGETAAAALDLPSGCETHVVAWDATAVHTHADCVDTIVGIVGDLDIVVMAAGVYGSTKAGLDAYAQGLADHLAGTGVNVTIVRPGFVTGRMTNGMKAAPFATTPAAVAVDTARAINRNQRIVHSPGILRWVFLILRHLPNTLWRRIPG